MKKKWHLIFAACVLMAAGCQHVTPGPRDSSEGFDPKVFIAPDPMFPKVFITKNGNIVVDQEPIRIPKGESPRVKIAWLLPAGTFYTFPANGIEINERQKQALKFDCAVAGPRKVIVCTFDRPPSGRPIKYTIRVKDGTKDLPDLDPSIMPE
jgi:hypothetical protein